LGFDQELQNVCRMSSKCTPLTFSKLSFGYDAQRPILQGLNGAFVEKGIHLIIGKNGVGKSTMLRVLAGLMEPLAGVVKIGDQPIQCMSQLERAQQISFVHSLPPKTSELSVAEVLALVSEDEEKNRGALRSFGEVDWWNQSLHTLSDGQAQRVMFTRVMLQNTEWTILDEPTAFLDVPSKMAFWKELGIASVNGKGFIIATHDYAELSEHVNLASVHLIDESHWMEIDLASNPRLWHQQMG